MGVRKLQMFIESETPSSVFRNVKIKELKENYQKEYPGHPVELLIDLDCCLPHLFPDYMVDPKYGGELATVVLYTLEEFYQRFNEIGIRLIAFLSNYKPKSKRARWIDKRYIGVDTVSRVLASFRASVACSTPVPMKDPNNYEVSPSELASTAADVIRFELHETVVHSFTENVSEIITYATKHQTFGILSQDTDFCIANAAQYNLTIEHLCLRDMTTCIYDSHGLASHLQLQVNQLPLFATIMGNDIMQYDVMKLFQYNTMKLGRGGIFVKNIASLCRDVECDDNGYPLDKMLMVNLSKMISTKTYSCTKVYNLMTDSISSYHIYSVEKELLIDKLDKSSDQRNIVRLALTLYRQCWITCDVLMLLCTKEMQMDTCIEMFDAINIKPIGDVLARLRKVLYGAAFNSDQNLVISEYVITGDKCLDKGVPTVTPAKLDSVQKLYDVWNQCSYYSTSVVCKAWEPLTEFVLIDNRLLFKVINQKTYFVTLFAQSCDLKPCVVEKLIALLPALPPKVHVPIFAFLYLDHEPGAFLSTVERHSVLFTFSLVSLLSSNQVKKFLNLNKKAESVELIRATNLFMKTSQLIVNLNALCGFSLGSNYTTHNKLNDLNCHNYWQGSIAQQFYHYLSEGNKQPLDLFNSLCSILKHTIKSGFFPQRTQFLSSRHESILYKFVNMMNCWTQLELFDELMTKAVQDMLKTVSTDPDHKYKR
uniref:Constitutive coactivator of peroxisome proliferator-activated receptor gamma n=1 Tax=Cacopsylla melanoneura TaxID=428564 RepID=A0A8D8X5R5_9HEMI